MFPRARNSSAAVILATSLAMFASSAFGDEPVVKASRTRTLDVRLSPDGQLVGHVIDHKGTAVSGVRLELVRRDTRVATLRSDDQGQFGTPPLAGGLYQCNVNGQQQWLRLWSNETAPPLAADTLTVIHSPVVRGQDAFDELETDEILVGGIATAALAVGIVALVEAREPASP